jgi:hypothetical protein
MPDWNAHPQHYRGYLYVDAPPVVIKCRVNQLTTTFPTAEIAIDGFTVGAFGDALFGMLVLMGSTDGADDLGRGYVREAWDAAVANINWASRGDHDGEFDVIDDAYITVLETYPVYARTPRITDEIVILKDYEIAFTVDIPGIVNIGGGMGWIDWIDPVDGVAHMPALVATGTPMKHADTVSGYAWDIGDCDLVAGDIATNTVTLDVPQGRRIISCTVTFDSGATKTRRLLVVADDRDDPTLLVRDFTTDPRSLRVEGQRMRFHIKDALPPATYPDGTMILYFEEEYFGDELGPVAGPTGWGHIKFGGWMQRDQATIRAQKTGLLRDTTIECVDVAGRLATLPGYPQAIQHKNVPNKWTKMIAPTIDKYVHHLLEWGSTAMTMADLNLSGNVTHGFRALGSNGENLWDQADKRAQAIETRLTCDQLGRMWMLPMPHHLDSADRTSEIQQDISEADFSELAWDGERAPRLHWLKGYGILAQTNTIEAVHCIAPGKAPGQGEGAKDEVEHLVRTQEELNSRIGHRYARQNAPQGLFNITLAHGNDAGIEPAHMEWVRLTLGAQYAAQRGLTFTNERFLPVEVTYTHHQDKTGRYKTCRVRMERETVGTPAQTVLRERGSVTTTPIVIYGTVYPPPTSAVPDPTRFLLRDGLIDMAAVCDDGDVYITNDFETPFASNGPAWVPKDMNVVGTPIAFTVDPWSPGYVGGGSAINGWVLTTQRIYRLENIFGAMTTTLQYTLAGTIRDGDIQAPWGQRHWVIANLDYATNSPEGNYCAYTTDGLNWSETVISTIPSVVAANNMETPGLYALSRIPGTAYAAAMITSTTARLHKTTNYGLTWAAQAVLDVLHSNGAIHVPWHDNEAQSLIYYATRSAGPPLNGLRKYDGVSVTTITPGTNYGPRFRQWSLYASPQNRLVMVTVGSQESGGDGTRPFVSTDGGTNWTARDSHRTTARYLNAAIGGDNDQVLYLWGEDGRIAYSPDQGATIDDRRGNIASFGPGTILAIAGGPN